MRKAVVAVILVLIAPLTSPAAHKVQDVTGRWDFQVITGDTAAQLSQMGQTEFETYLLQSGTTLSDIALPTTDTSACDEISDGNVTASGTVSPDGTVTTVFNITGNGAAFTFTFTGKLSGHGHGLTMTGTWTTTATCSAAAGAHGDFKAWRYPDMSGLYTGAFDGPSGGAGPTQIAASIKLVTESDKSLGGYIDAPRFSLDGTSNTAACFIPFSDGHTLHLISGYAAFAGVPMPKVSQQAGYTLDLFAVDAAGNRFWGSATNPNRDGTNGSYTIWYGISGGPCDGFGGGDAPFTPVEKSVTNARPRLPRHGRGPLVGN